MQYQQYIGVIFTFFLALGLNAAQQGLYLDPFYTVFLPDWVLLLVFFWGMRIPGLGYIWAVWCLGFVQGSLHDDLYGAHSFLYVLSGFMVQNARLRLAVVSVFTRWCFIIFLIVMYVVMLNLSWRFMGDGLQWHLILPVAGHVFGWWLVGLSLAPLYPLSPLQDLFEASERQL